MCTPLFEELLIQFLTLEHGSEIPEIQVLLDLLAWLSSVQPLQRLLLNSSCPAKNHILYLDKVGPEYLSESDHCVRFSSDERPVVQTNAITVIPSRQFRHE